MLSISTRRGYDPNEEKQVEIGVPTVGDEAVAVAAVEAADAPRHGAFEVTVATGGKNLGLDLDNSSMRLAFSLCLGL